jgi:hypothetical protein
MVHELAMAVALEAEPKAASFGKQPLLECMPTRSAMYWCLVSLAFCQVIITMSELGVPEALEAGPKSGQQLAQQLAVHREYLERVLAVAERIKLVSVTQPQPGSADHKLYHLTQLSAVLCESHPNSVKHMVGAGGTCCGTVLAACLAPATQDDHMTLIRFSIE